MGDTNAGKKERLDKWIASQGSWSRKQVKDLVRTGQIIINGTAATAADMKISEADEIVVSGKALRLQRHIYIMMNKPAGVVSATEDKRDKTVMELLSEELRRPGLFPAGRLDKDTEGFLLLTDDGAFAHNILAPGKHVPKTYYVRVENTGAEAGRTPQQLIDEFAVGVSLGQGEASTPAELVWLPSREGQEAELTIYEGIFHQVKRMFMRFGFRVTYLRRIRIGKLNLDENLPLGAARVIMHNELLEIC